MKSNRTECCSERECESGLRNNYFEGKRLTADSFRIEQSYALDRRRLLNRAIFGYGVVYGFAIEVSKDRLKLQIGAGLALDACGRELVQVGDATLSFDELIVVEPKGLPVESNYWLLSAHYAEQKTGAVTVKDACNCEHTEWDRTCETIRYSLRRVPYALCCVDDQCKWSCLCATGQCCAEKPGEPPHPPRRGGCRCLCEHLTDLEILAGCCEPSHQRDEECGIHLRVDLDHEVPLACIELPAANLQSRTFGTIDPCGPRPLVKRNDLLFELIRGCDLTKIEEIGWYDWHRKTIEFSAFAGGFDGEPYGKNGQVAGRFSVRFSRPVREDTLRPDCFAMQVLFHEREGGWRQALRVPIVGVDSRKFPADHKGDPPHCVRGATLVVDRRWVSDAIRGGYTQFGRETRVEIEIRGDFILDCNGQAVDADAFGLSPAPGGNGAPGGTFLSTFVVKAAPKEESAEDSEGVSS